MLCFTVMRNHLSWDTILSGLLYCMYNGLFVYVWKNVQSSCHKRPPISKDPHYWMVTWYRYSTIQWLMFSNHAYSSCHKRPPFWRDHIIEWALHTGLIPWWHMLKESCHTCHEWPPYLRDHKIDWSLHTRIPSYNNWYFRKSYLFSLSWKTTCLKRPPYLLALDTGIPNGDSYLQNHVHSTSNESLPYSGVHISGWSLDTGSMVHWYMFIKSCTFSLWKAIFLGRPPW